MSDKENIYREYQESMLSATNWVVSWLRWLSGAWVAVLDGDEKSERQVQERDIAKEFVEDIDSLGIKVGLRGCHIDGVMPGGHIMVTMDAPVGNIESIGKSQLVKSKYALTNTDNVIYVQKFTDGEYDKMNVYYGK